MPLQFDMPWKELQSYQGTNPKPGDFDDFWAAALEEVGGLDPQVELVEAGFQTPFARCYDMTFTGMGGARMYAKVLKPIGADLPGPAVLMFHGYSMNSGDWSD